MQVISETRIYKRIEVKAARFQICGDADQDFVHLGIPGMKFKVECDESHGYFYDNWTLPELRELSNGIHEFIRLHDKGAVLVGTVEAQPVAGVVKVVE